MNGEPPEVQAHTNIFSQFFLMIPVAFDRDHFFLLAMTVARGLALAIAMWLTVLGS